MILLVYTKKSQFELWLELTLWSELTAWYEFVKWEKQVRSVVQVGVMFQSQDGYGTWVFAKHQGCRIHVWTVWLRVISRWSSGHTGGCVVLGACLILADWTQVVVADSSHCGVQVTSSSSTQFYGLSCLFVCLDDLPVKGVPTSLPPCHKQGDINKDCIWLF